MPERELAELRQLQWFGSPRPDELRWRLRHPRRSRRAARWAMLPLLALSVAATVAGVREWFAVPVTVEFDIDGTIVGAGTAPLVVGADGTYPVRVELPGHGPVDLTVELPPNLPPDELVGRRLHVIFSTDPDGVGASVPSTGQLPSAKPTGR